MPLLPQQILCSLQQAPACETYLVALSGGLDSNVLLHALHRLRAAGELTKGLAALHINHGLHAAANTWQTHCENLCAQLDIPLLSEAVSVSATGSLENAARSARYEAFACHTGKSTLLLQAHHLDDQLETLLQRLLRGAGVRGLAGMPQQRGLGHGYLFRPLLQISREELHDYATHHALHWQEDGSNQDQAHARNFLRHSIWPLIAERWPAYRVSVSKSLVLINEAAELAAELAAQDLGTLESSTGGLQLSGLLELSAVRQKNLLRYWLANLGLAEPGWNQLNSMVKEFLVSSANEASFPLSGGVLKVFNGELFLLANVSLDKLDEPVAITLSSNSTLQLPANGELTVSVSHGGGIKAVLGQLQVRYRQGGEQLQLPGRPTKSLKSLFQESHTPPWIRDRVPLLFHQQLLVCVPGLGIAQAAQAAAGEPSCRVEWQPPTLVLGKRQ